MRPPDAVPKREIQPADSWHPYPTDYKEVTDPESSYFTPSSTIASLLSPAFHPPRYAAAFHHCLRRPAVPLYRIRQRTYTAYV